MPADTHHMPTEDYRTALSSHTDAAVQAHCGVMPSEDDCAALSAADVRTTVSTAHARATLSAPDADVPPADIGVRRATRTAATDGSRGLSVSRSMVRLLRPVRLRPMGIRGSVRGVGGAGELSRAIMAVSGIGGV